MGDGSGLILGVSGLRGIVGEDLTPEVAVRYAGAVGTWFREQVGDVLVPFLAVARDGRFGGEALYQCVCGALRSAGCDVVELDVAMTPTVGVIVDHLALDGALILTASHNPQRWNGIKVLVSPDGFGVKREDGTIDACAPNATIAQELVDRYTAGSIVWRDNYITGDRRLTHSESSKAPGRHVEFVEDAIERVFGERFRDLKKSESLKFKSVVVDSVNSSGVAAVEEMFHLPPVSCINVAGNRSGFFPHTPEPTAENLGQPGGLCDVVRGAGAIAGFAQDPDADRLAIVDETGAYIGEEYTLVLCAMALMEARMGKGAGEGKPVFVVNLSTSRMIDDVAKHYGGEVVRTAVGEANVVEAMKRLKGEGRDVVLGGEGNGGVIWPEVTYVRDSLSGMGLVLSLMARTGKSVSELVGMVNGMGPTDEVRAQGYTILKSKSGLAKKEDARPVVDHLAKVYGGDPSARVDLQDGIRVDWDERGVWAHVRASNTEPIMRVIVEAPSSGEAERTAESIGAEIARLGEVE